VRNEIRAGLGKPPVKTTITDEDRTKSSSLKLVRFSTVIRAVAEQEVMVAVLRISSERLILGRCGSSWRDTESIESFVSAQIGGLSDSESGPVTGTYSGGR
jgi:hypothetical protein